MFYFILFLKCKKVHFQYGLSMTVVSPNLCFLFTDINCANVHYTVDEHMVRTGPGNPGNPWKPPEKPWNFSIKSWKISENLIEN